MKAIIPAAGIGTRLRPHTFTLPKALLFIAGKPIISHILDDILALDVSSVVLIVGYKGDLIEEYVRKHYPDAPVEFVVQRERRGIGHAVDMTRGVAESDEPLLIVLGDTIIKTDLSAITRCRANALGVKEVSDPRRFGVCELADGRITRLVEKPKNPPSNLALVGLYWVRDARGLFAAIRRVIDEDIRTRDEYQITDALQIMIDDGAVFEPFEIEEWFDCGKPDAMLATNRRLLEDSGAATRIDGSVVIPPVSISPEAEVVESVVGPHVSVAGGARVERSIVRDSIIAAGATVRNALLEGSLVGENAVVEGTFNRVNIGDSSEVINH